MNYEQKYKEALKRMKSWVRGEHPECFCEAQKAAEFIFPELAESEDERIRKDIIAYLRNEKNVKRYIFDIDIDKSIAWLEKQGEIDLEHYKDGENEKRKFVGYGFLKCKGDFLSFKEGETYWLEYVGKDNYNVRSDNLLGQTFHIKPVELYTVFRPTTWLEKQGKSSDKAEPRFKVGDKVVAKSYKADVKTIEKVSQCGTYWTSSKGYHSGWWVEDELEPYIEQKTLNADDVIEWIECKAFQGWAEEINIKQIVDKFKGDFGL